MRKIPPLTQPVMGGMTPIPGVVMNTITEAVMQGMPVRAPAAASASDDAPRVSPTFGQTAAQTALDDARFNLELLNRTVQNTGRTTMQASEQRRHDEYVKTIDDMSEVVAAEEFRREQMRGVVAPSPSPDDSYVPGQPLAADQSFVGAMRTLNRIPDIQDDQPLSMGKYLRGALTGRWDGASNELQVHNAMSGASGASGGILIPEILTGQIVDQARARTRVIQAGARVVPMANRKVVVPKWLSDPTPQWRGENDPFVEDDAELGSLELTAHGLGVVTKLSIELLEDTDLEGEVEAAFARSFAQVVDEAALYATGADDSPVGIKATPGVNVQAAATNGAVPTWATLVDAVGRLRDVNEEPNAQVMSDRTARTLALLVGAGGQYVAPPTYLDGVTRYTTSQVPNTLTTGTSSGNTSDVFTADWTKLLIGVRSELRIIPLRERYLPDSGQIALLAYWRGDFGVTRPKAFDVVTGVKA